MANHFVSNMMDLCGVPYIDAEGNNKLALPIWMHSENSEKVYILYRIPMFIKNEIITASSINGNTIPSNVEIVLD